MGSGPSRTPVLIAQIAETEDAATEVHIQNRANRPSKNALKSRIFSLRWTSKFG